MRQRHGRIAAAHWIVAAALLTFFLPAGRLQAALIINRAQLAAWGLETHDETVATLGLPNQRLFAEKANLDGRQSGGVNGKAFVWPLSTVFRVQTSLARLDPATYRPVLREFADQLHATYWSATGGYRSGASRSSERFYDDNAHLAVALAEAYEVTRDPVYLSRAKQTLNFVLSGEDTVGGGGVYWSEWNHTFKDTIATVQGARAALKIYQATGERPWLEDAARLYGWAHATTQQADGLFMEKLFLTGSKAGKVGDYALVNSAGMAISTNVEIYEATRNEGYLREARRIATRSLSRYFDSATGRLNDEGFWAFELSDALVDLYAADGDPRWLSAVNNALVWLHNNKRDAAGHYGRFWGRDGAQTTLLATWELNDMAPISRAYLHTALVPEPALLTLSLLVSAILLRPRRRRLADLSSELY